MYNHLSITDQRLLEGDKVLFLIKVVELKDTCELGSHLKVEAQPNSLMTAWTIIKKACKWIDESGLMGPILRETKPQVLTMNSK